MGDAIPTLPPPVPQRASVSPSPSPSPVPGTQIIPGRLPTSGDRGLVPVVRLTYAAPGGDYSRLQFSHREGCSNDTLDFADEVRHILCSLNPRSFDLVENLCVGILAARGCDTSPITSLECHLDRTTTLGFYTRFHSVEGSSQSFQPSGSQLVSTYTPSTMASDPMVPSASWPTIEEARSQYSQEPPEIPSVVVVDDSQPSLPSPVERLSSNERMMYRNFQLDRSSDEDYAPPAGRAAPESQLTQVTSPPPQPPRIQGSGFAPDSRIPDGRRPVLPVSRRQHEFIAHTRERRGNTPPKDASPSPPLLTTSQVFPSSAIMIRDTPMDLGGGSNTDGTGIGDSRYATDAQPRSAAPTVSPCASPSFSSLPALPLTIEYRPPSQVDADLMAGLNDIREGSNVPAWSSSED